jgi:hypothetical protein
MRFPLYKLFLVAAIYAASMAACSRLGASAVIAVWIGTGLSGIALLSSRRHVWSIVTVAIGSCWGALLGAVCLTEPILYEVYLYDHGFGEYQESRFLASAIGAAAGGFIVSLLTRRGRH